MTEGAAPSGAPCGDFAPRDRASGPGQAGYNRLDSGSFRRRSSGPRPAIEGSPT